MSKVRRPVTVTTQLQEIRYDWATSVTVRRDGSIAVYDGWRQRAYHPAGEWTMFTVQPADTEPWQSHTAIK